MDKFFTDFINTACSVANAAINAVNSEVEKVNDNTNRNTCADATANHADKNHDTTRKNATESVKNTTDNAPADDNTINVIVNADDGLMVIDTHGKKLVFPMPESVTSIHDCMDHVLRAISIAEYSAANGTANTTADIKNKAETPIKKEHTCNCDDTTQTQSNCHCKTKSASKRVEINADNIYNQIDRVMYKDNATIVFFKDGTKSVAKCDAEDMKSGQYNPVTGLSIAVLKRLIGNNNYHELIAANAFAEYERRKKANATTNTGSSKTQPATKKTTVKRSTTDKKPAAETAKSSTKKTKPAKT